MHTEIYLHLHFHSLLTMSQHLYVLFAFRCACRAHQVICYDLDTHDVLWYRRRKNGHIQLCLNDAFWVRLEMPKLHWSHANTFVQDLKSAQSLTKAKHSVHNREMRLPPARRNLSRVGRFWNLPHWHLPEPKPHCGSLESRVEWQHFLHPFRVPQYGKHLNLLKKKSQVVQWLRSDCFFYLFLYVCVCVYVGGHWYFG